MNPVRPLSVPSHGATVGVDYPGGRVARGVLVVVSVGRRQAIKSGVVLDNNIIVILSQDLRIKMDPYQSACKDPIHGV